MNIAALNVGLSAAIGLGVLMTACGVRKDLSRTALESRDPATRAAAVIQAAEAEDRGAIPSLVDRLEDEDPAVRMLAILALERITGTRLGYRHQGSPDERRAAVDRWRSWVMSGAQLGGSGDAKERQ